MPANSTTINLGSPPDYYYFAPYINTNLDGCYQFYRGTRRWMLLVRYAPFVAVPETPAVFYSDDDGATWTLADQAGAPSISVVALTPLVWDIRLGAGLAPADTDHATALFVDTAEDGTFQLCDFNFDTASWGAPYGAFTDTLLSTSLYTFSSRPDGALIIAALYAATSNTKVRIYSGSAWGSAVVVASSFPANLLVDAASKAFLIVGTSLYVLDTAGGVIATAPLPAGYTPHSNLRQVGASLLVAAVDGVGVLYLLTYASGSWSVDAIAGALAARHYVWVVRDGSATVVYWIDSSDKISRQRSFAPGTWSSPELVWDWSTDTNPDIDNREPTVFSLAVTPNPGGGFECSAEASINSSFDFMFTFHATGGQQPAARYYGH